jgi:DNA-binding MarR family transcriptional regulator
MTDDFALLQGIGSAMSNHRMTGAHLAILAASARKPGITLGEINAAGDWKLTHGTASSLEDKGLIFSSQDKERRMHACSVRFHVTAEGEAVLRELARAGKALLLAERNAA